MSILIKGMKMPENCGECIWIQRGYPDWCDLPMGKDLYNDKKRPDWCPLVEVPTPHGRLIDAGELEDKLDAWTRENFSFSDRYQYNLEGMIRARDFAMALPTIIEAEEQSE